MGRDPDGKRCSVLGYQVWSASIERLVTELDGCVRSVGPCRTLYCLNPHSVVAARDDGAYQRALRRADWLVPDGIGVVAAAHLLCRDGAPGGRITGSDVFQALSQSLNARRRASVFFMGSTEATLKRMAERSRSEWPNVCLAGYVAPSFGEHIPGDEGAEIVGAINASGADVLWVGMTAPKQEKWIDQNVHQLKCGLACGVGAVFDFYAETFRRPGVVAQRFGLEWAVRLCRDPRRLWRRSLVSAPVFGGLVAAELVRLILRRLVR